jgi:hypothetical protein
VLPDDILYLEDRTIHGWIDKLSKIKGYFGLYWKRYYVICTDFKLNYYLDPEKRVQKGLINFTEVPSKMSVH